MPLKRFSAAFAAYLIPSFIVAMIWHLMIFESYYDALKIYREEVIVPFGMASMVIQASFFGGAYPKLFGGLSFKVGSMAAWIVFSLIGVSYTVLPVAAKFPMTSISDFVIIETAFNVVQFSVCVPLIAYVWRETA